MSEIKCGHTFQGRWPCVLDAGHDGAHVNVSEDVQLRCANSGNPCGTDTRMLGSHCECTPCRQWLAAFRQGLEAAERVARQQAETWRQHADTLQIGSPQRRKASVGEDTSLVIASSIRVLVER